MTKYSKQTYEEHAQVLRTVYEVTVDKKKIGDFYNGVVHSLAELYRIDNPRFDKKRFLEACGVKKE